MIYPSCLFHKGNNGGGSEIKLTDEQKNRLVYSFILMFFMLYVTALSFGSGRDFLIRIFGILYSLAPTQTSNWLFISLIELGILLVVVFVLGCMLIARCFR